MATVLMVFILLEAVFTATTISTIKPIKELLTGENFVEELRGSKDNKTELPPGKFKAFVNQQKERAIALVEPTLAKLQAKADSGRDGKWRVMIILISMMIGAALLTAFCGFWVGYLSNFMATTVVKRLRDHTFSHMMTLDLAYFTGHPPGAIMSVVLQDIKSAEGAVDLLFSNVLKTPVTVVVFVTGMLLISPGLTLTTFIIVPILSILLFVVGSRIRHTTRKQQKMLGKLASVMEESISGVRVVKAHNMEVREAERFMKENKKIFRNALRSKAAEELGTSFTQFAGIAIVAVVLLLGAHQILSGKLTSSLFIIFVPLLMQLFRPLKGMARVTSRLQRGLAGCDRVFHVLDMEAKLVTPANPKPVVGLTHGIEFRNVSFAYPGEPKLAIDNISLTLKAGRSIALVGETGSGKSTLVNMLPRYYDPTAGQILYDGTDVRELDLKALRRQIAIITQDILLFDETVVNNIAYGAENEPDRERAIQAARAANAEEFILGKSLGYDSPVGAKGVMLSGGQRQRIAIARAIYKDVPILILDEATSALDSKTEAQVQLALENLMRGKTVVVVAHRLSTIRNCHEIYVMHHGRFVEHGTHDELLARGGHYSRFYNLQFGNERLESQPTSEVDGEGELAATEGAHGSI